PSADKRNRRTAPGHWKPYFSHGHDSKIPFLPENPGSIPAGNSRSASHILFPRSPVQGQCPSPGNYVARALPIRQNRTAARSFSHKQKSYNDLSVTRSFSESVRVLPLAMLLLSASCYVVSLVVTIY